MMLLWPLLKFDDDTKVAASKDDIDQLEKELRNLCQWSCDVHWD